VETHASQSPALRARIRRSLIQLGSLLAMALVIVGVFAMFSVWSLNRAHIANYENASRLMFALDDGRSAQTLFKIQVQEWKNILLRGSDESDFKRHLDAFAADETKVQHHLDRLAARADGLGLSRIALGARSMAREHRALGEAYRAALDKGRSVPWDPFTIDRQVRGIDRPLNTALDKVAVSLLAETEQRRSDASRQEEARYRTLRAFMGWSIAVSIGIVGLVLWTALRRRPDRA
jgi:hypothetical protein